MAYQDITTGEGHGPLNTDTAEIASLLVRCAQRGDSDECVWGQGLALAQSLAMRLPARYFNSDADRDDVAQDALLSILKRREAPMRSALRQVRTHVRDAAIDRLRHEGYRSGSHVTEIGDWHQDRGTCVLEGVAERHAAEALRVTARAVLSQRSPRDQVMILSLLEGVPPRKVAEADDPVLAQQLADDAANAALPQAEVARRSKIFHNRGNVALHRYRRALDQTFDKGA